MSDDVVTLLAAQQPLNTLDQLVSVSVRVDSDLLQLLVTHVGQNIQADLDTQGLERLEPDGGFSCGAVGAEGGLWGCVKTDLLPFEDVPQMFQPQTLQELTYIHVQHGHCKDLSVRT